MFHYEIGESFYMTTICVNASDISPLKENVSVGFWYIQVRACRPMR